MKSCLIVDDSRVVRKVARQIMESSGFSCEEAENGQAALDVCRQKLPDIALMDCNMPVMDGVECVKAIRKLPDGEKAFVIFCSTENDIQHIQAALEAGANEYIMKPFDGDIVRDKLSQLGLIEA